MGKSRDNKYDKNSFLLRWIIVVGFLFINSILFADNGLYHEKVQPFIPLIDEKVNALNNDFPDFQFEVKFNEEKLILIANGIEIAGLYYTDFDKNKMVSLFIKTRSNAMIKRSLFLHTLYEVEVDALYEYPFLDQTGRFFIYISDKTYGNRNPFILDLQTLKEKEIVVPQSSEYFPVLCNGFLFFLCGKSNYYSLQKYSFEDESIREIASGQITCLRTYNNKLYYSDNNHIFVIDDDGTQIESYAFSGFIQSFSIKNQNIFLSLNKHTQFDLFCYTLSNGTITRLTNTPFNEVDISDYYSDKIIYSSNKTGTFNLYSYDISERQYQSLLSNPKNDYFYPFFAEKYKTIIVSTFTDNKEPFFSFHPLSVTD
jgi:hypothetical protein